MKALFRMVLLLPPLLLAASANVSNAESPPNEILMNATKLTCTFLHNKILGGVQMDLSPRMVKFQMRLSFLTQSTTKQKKLEYHWVIFIHELKKIIRSNFEHLIIV
jgi:hypothetical protein